MTDGTQTKSGWLLPAIHLNLAMHPCDQRRRGEGHRLGALQGLRHWITRVGPLRAPRILRGQIGYRTISLITVQSRCGEVIAFSNDTYKPTAVAIPEATGKAGAITIFQHTGIIGFRFMGRNRYHSSVRHHPWPELTQGTQWHCGCSGAGRTQRFYCWPG